MRETTIAGVIIAVIITLLLGIILGPKGCQQTMKRVKSNYIGLNRVATLYANDGSVITNYEGRFQVEFSEGGSAARFIIDNKTIHMSGTYTIVEK